MNGIENGLEELTEGSKEGEEVIVVREVEVVRVSSDKAGIASEVVREVERDEVCREGNIKDSGEVEIVVESEVEMESGLVNM